MLNDAQLFARWLTEFAAGINPPQGILKITAAEPRPATRNFFTRFKVVTATFAGDGTNPTNPVCVVVEVSATDQTAMAVEDTCESIGDL